MTDTTTPLQPEERTEEQIAADLEWLKELRAQRFEKVAGFYAADLANEQKGR